MYVWSRPTGKRQKEKKFFACRMPKRQNNCRSVDARFDIFLKMQQLQYFVHLYGVYLHARSVFDGFYSDNAGGFPSRPLPCPQFRAPSKMARCHGAVVAVNINENHAMCSIGGVSFFSCRNSMAIRCWQPINTAPAAASSSAASAARGGGESTRTNTDRPCQTVTFAAESPFRRQLFQRCANVPQPRRGILGAANEQCADDVLQTIISRGTRTVVCPSVNPAVRLTGFHEFMRCGVMCMRKLHEDPSIVVPVPFGCRSDRSKLIDSMPNV
jgi:hypothetical protein